MNMYSHLEVANTVEVLTVFSSLSQFAVLKLFTYIEE